MERERNGNEHSIMEYQSSTMITKGYAGEQMWRWENMDQTSATSSPTCLPEINELNRNKTRAHRNRVKHGGYLIRVNRTNQPPCNYMNKCGECDRNRYIEVPKQ